jgi:hypothetical protein
LRLGQVYIQPLHTLKDGKPLRVPFGLIHHWVSVAFIPQATIPQVADVLQDYEHQQDIYKPDVRKSKLLERNESEVRVFMQLCNRYVARERFSCRLELNHLLHTSTALRMQRLISCYKDRATFTHRKVREKLPGRGGLMKVNIYEEELTERIEIRKKRAETGTEYYGLQFFLHSSERLHRRPGDDDSSAVVFWSKEPENLRPLSALRDFEWVKQR